MRLHLVYIDFSVSISSKVSCRHKIQILDADPYDALSRRSFSAKEPRATNYGAFLRKMTKKDKASYRMAKTHRMP